MIDHAVVRAVVDIYTFQFPFGDGAHVARFVMFPYTVHDGLTRSSNFIQYIEVQYLSQVDCFSRLCRIAGSKPKPEGNRAGALRHRFPLELRTGPTPRGPDKLDVRRQTVTPCSGRPKYDIRMRIRNSVFFIDRRFDPPHVNRESFAPHYAESVDPLFRKI